MRDEVVRLAREAHQAHWRMSCDEGTGDRLATQVCCAWQAGVRQLDPARFVIEARIGGGLREWIDVVDRVDGVAYELKVSPNNAHFEFYRDVFKVMLAKTASLPQLRQFLFLAPAPAAKKLMANMGGAVVRQQLGLPIHIEIVGL
jgi:hypothetical protein